MCVCACMCSWLTSISLMCLFNGIQLALANPMPHNFHYYSFTLCLDMYLENTLNLTFFLIVFLVIYTNVLFYRNTKEREKKVRCNSLVSYMWQNHIYFLGIGEFSSFMVGTISNYYICYLILYFLFIMYYICYLILCFLCIMY